MVSLARRLKFSPQDCRQARLAGLFLDIGVSQSWLSISRLPHQDRFCVQSTR